MSKYSELQKIVDKVKLNHKVLTKEFYNFLNVNKVKLFEGTERKGYTATGEYLLYQSTFLKNIMDNIELDLIFGIHSESYKYLPKKSGK